jgi:hypothetical protein
MQTEILAYREQLGSSAKRPGIAMGNVTKIGHITFLLIINIRSRVEAMKPNKILV